MKADRAIRLNNRVFAGSDTLATAMALSLALEREECDLIICGSNSSDSEIGQVGPEITEMLGIPKITSVFKVEFERDSTSIKAIRLNDEVRQNIRCDLPALISVTDLS